MAIILNLREYYILKAGNDYIESIKIAGVAVDRNRARESKHVLERIVKL